MVKIAIEILLCYTFPMEKKIIATNKKAFIKYNILDKIEAGLVLQGTEVKSLRANKVDIKDSFARMQTGEVFLHNLYIAPYNQASYNNAEPRRIRKLLLHKKEITKLIGKITQKGLTLIPLQLYFNKSGRAKVELALAKGQRLYDQREKIKKKETDRQLRKVTSFRNK